MMMVRITISKRKFSLIYFFFFMNLDFVIGGDGQAQTGDESCDYTIDGSSDPSGSITSPSFPGAYPGNITCRYHFIGVIGTRLQLRFTHMDLYYPHGDPRDPFGCDDSDFVAVYRNDAQGRKRIDAWCGRKMPPMLMSGPPIYTNLNDSLYVEFQSVSRESTNSTGFKAEYAFITDYGVGGDGQVGKIGDCVFEYDSRNNSSGEFQSPSYGGLYPPNIECQYLFYGQQGEKVRIEFQEFDVDGILPKCEKETGSDYVSFSNFAYQEDRRMPKFCGHPIPPSPKRIVTSDGPFFQVTFRSDHKYEGFGFRAKYRFVSAQEGDLNDSTDNESVDSVQRKCGECTDEKSESETETGSDKQTTTSGPRMDELVDIPATTVAASKKPAPPFVKLKWAISNLEFRLKLNAIFARYKKEGN